jgi:hypothetical protein
MQLNESTYETIFLLYIDNELSPKERLEVEAFIADNPNYALEMEALQATVLRSEQLQYPFKENLKQHLDATSLEDLEKEWNQTYATILKADVDAIPSLSNSFKNTLKKEATKEGIVIKPFGFNQQKFTYAVVAACLMAFIGYQQLTKTSVADSPTANSFTTNSNTVLVPTISKTIATASGEAVISTKQVTTAKLQVSNSSKRKRSYKVQNETIAIAEPTRNNSILNNQAITTKLPSSYNNPMTIDAMPLTISSTNLDADPTEVEKELTSYEIIDTEDPNRTIFIANFEIDGNKFRGLTRRVSALLKRNKSEKEK